MNRNSIIIVAGGKGLRMGGELPKQFIPLGGKPILMHTIEAFFNYDNEIQIILVLPQSHHEYWSNLCSEYNFSVKHQIAIGGETRFYSVRNGLILANGEYIGIHDGVRPFVSADMIARCYNTVKEYKAVIPVVDSTDSLREIGDDGKSKIIDRNRIKLVQTPQVFDAGLLRKAYKTEYKDSFTDDASVVESTGHNIYLEKGETSNIKITTPIDLQIGELLFKSDK